jgi:hypothetical protein
MIKNCVISLLLESILICFMLDFCKNIVNYPLKKGVYLSIWHF